MTGLIDLDRPTKPPASTLRHPKPLIDCAIALACALLVGCGGSGDDPVSEADNALQVGDTYIQEISVEDRPTLTQSYLIHGITR